MSSAPIIPPDLHVVAGTPDDDELAALVAGLHVVSQISSVGVGAEAPSVWVSRARSTQRSFAPGPNRWRWRDH